MNPLPPLRLTRALNAILPGVSLRIQSLPELPQLTLALLEDTFPRTPLSSETATRVMENPLYWIFCWASGRVMAQYIHQHADTFRDQTVIDFGCGSGVVAIAAAQAGARHVIACDIDPLAREATRFNAALNNVVLDIRDDFERIESRADCIVVADVLYDRANLSWLTRFAAAADRVLVADSRVRNFELPPYRAIAVEDSCTLPDLDESAEFRRVTLYEAVSS